MDPVPAAPDEPGAPPRRRPGRPRRPGADESILAAAEELLIERGFDGLSIEDVATRAGVAKTTLYRRWHSKEELVLHVLAASAEADAVVTPTGDTRADLVQFLSATISLARGEANGSMARVVGRAKLDGRLAENLRFMLLAPQRERFRAILRHGIEQGELRADLDFVLVHQMLQGPALHLDTFGADPSLVDGGRTVDEPEVLAARIVDLMWPALLAAPKGHA